MEWTDSQKRERHSADTAKDPEGIGDEPFPAVMLSWC